MSDDEFEFLGLDKKELLGVGNLAGHYANNQTLKNIQGRGPACPHCAGNLAKSGVGVCMHCGRDVFWDYGRALTLGELKQLLKAREIANERVLKLVAEKEFDSAIALMESVLDRDRVESLRAEKKDNAKIPAAKAHAAKISAEREKAAKEKRAEERQYGKSQLDKEAKRNDLLEPMFFVTLFPFVFYLLYASPCFLLSRIGFNPWFWSSIPSVVHYSILVGIPSLNVVAAAAVEVLNRRERKAITLKKESRYKSSNQQKTIDSDKKKDTKKKPEPISYYLKRGETIRGPLERAVILSAATGKRLMSGDQIANSKAGPWQDITKEQLEQMQQGSDVMIRWLLPPQDREVLKKWLRSIGDQPSVSCPYCDISIKRSNLLKHCDKLHPINAS